VHPSTRPGGGKKKRDYRKKRDSPGGSKERYAIVRKKNIKRGIHEGGQVTKFSIRKKKEKSQRKQKTRRWHKIRKGEGRKKKKKILP